MYDARFGRWTSTDPYGQFWSPYVGMGNMPQMGVDPDGGWSGWWMIGGAVVGGVIGGFSDKDNPRRGAMIGMIIGAGAGYGASQINWSSIKIPSININPEGLIPAANAIASVGNTVDFFLGRPAQVNLSGSSDEIYNGILDWFDWLYMDEETNGGIRKPNDNRGTNFFNVNDMVRNPPRGFDAGDKTQSGRMNRTTSSGISYTVAIQPGKFENVDNYRDLYITGVRHYADKVGRFGFIYGEGANRTEGSYSIQIKIHGLENFNSAIKKILKSHFK